MTDKMDRLKSILRDMESALVAFSGGVDSTLLADVTYEVLGDSALAVTAVSATMPDSERAVAREMAERIGIRHLIIESDELNDPQFLANDEKRCYYCKKRRFSALLDIAAKEGLNYVIDGSNRDDLGDFRPGKAASDEIGVRSPLSEAGMTKDDIRSMARDRGITNWDKPAYACLATRIPYGTPIVPELLDRIAEAEAQLTGLGLRKVRVRYHGDVARIEVGPGEIGVLMNYEKRRAAVEALKQLGYRYVTLDLEGYRPSGTS